MFDFLQAVTFLLYIAETVQTIVCSEVPVVEVAPEVYIISRPPEDTYSDDTDEDEQEEEEKEEKEASEVIGITAKQDKEIGADAAATPQERRQQALLNERNSKEKKERTTAHINAKALRKFSQQQQQTLKDLAARASAMKQKRVEDKAS